jgi:hypothetical protein
MKKIITKEVQEEVKQMIITSVKKYGLTITNIQEIMEEVIEHMNDNATLEK